VKGEGKDLFALAMALSNVVSGAPLKFQFFFYKSLIWPCDV
jgi:hypothetical protein